MIAVIKPETTEKQLDNLVAWLERKGLGVHISVGSDTTIVGLIGDTSRIDISLLESMDIIESVTRVSEPFKAANRKFHPADTVVTISDTVQIGAGTFAAIAGPCFVEGENIFEIGSRVKDCGAAILSGAAFRLSSSPYGNEGMGAPGLDLLAQAARSLDMPCVSEVNDISQLDLFERFGIDIIQISARSMQNYPLLKEAAHTSKPIILKRGLASTVDELLMSAEHILSEGNSQVILCERGIRTYETRTRTTFDLNAIPVLHYLTHLPVIADPSYSCGHARYVEPMALAACACGADGLTIEVHNDPCSSWAQAGQALTCEQFAQLMPKLEALRHIVA